MEYAKKLILVDPSKMNLPAPTNVSSEKEKISDKLQDPLVQELQRLDIEMDNIVKDTNMTASEKVKKYNEALTRFQDSSKQIKETPIKVKITNAPQNNSSSEPINGDKHETETESTRTIESSLTDLPQNLKAKAQTIVDEWKKRKNIAVSTGGELIIDGQVLKNSNASLLFKTLIRSRIDPHKKHNPPIGWNEFIKDISALNLPQGLIQGWNSKSSTAAFSKSPKIKKQKSHSNRFLPYSKENFATGWIDFK